MGWLWAAAVAAAAIAALLASRVRIKLFFSRVGNDDHLLVEFRALYGIVRYKYDVPLIRFHGLIHLFDVKTERVDRKKNVLMDEKDSDISIENIQDFYRQAKLFTKRIEDFSGWMKWTFAKVRCTQLQWATYVGIGDAAETAIATGIIWGLKTSLLGFIFRYLKLDARPELLVQPQYNRKQFSVKLRCMVHIRFGLVLLAGMLLAVRFLRANRDYKKKNKTKLESNPAG